MEGKVKRWDWGMVLLQNHGEWHFFKTTVLERLVKCEENSEVLHRILSKKNNLPFMS